MLMGSIISYNRVTWQNYLDFLQNGLPGRLENVPLARGISVLSAWWSPSRYTRTVVQHLNDTFPNQWFGCGSTINWPPRSPDLTPLDFCLWVWNNGEVYRTKVDTPDELLNLIMDVITSVKEHQDTLRWATRPVLACVAKSTDDVIGILKNVLY